MDKSRKMVRKLMSQVAKQSKAVSKLRKQLATAEKELASQYTKLADAVSQAELNAQADNFIASVQD